MLALLPCFDAQENNEKSYKDGHGHFIDVVYSMSVHMFNQSLNLVYKFLLYKFYAVDIIFL